MGNRHSSAHRKSLIKNPVHPEHAHHEDAVTAGEVKNSPTSLLFKAITNKSSSAATTLIQRGGIDLSYIDPTTGNNLLGHVYATNSWWIVDSVAQLYDDTNGWQSNPADHTNWEGKSAIDLSLSNYSESGGGDHFFIFDHTNVKTPELEKKLQHVAEKCSFFQRFNKAGEKILALHKKNGGDPSELPWICKYMNEQFRKVFKEYEKKRIVKLQAERKKQDADNYAKLIALPFTEFIQKVKPYMYGQKDQIGDWFDTHPDFERTDETDEALSAYINSALAYCYRPGDLERIFALYGVENMNPINVTKIRDSIIKKKSWLLAIFLYAAQNKTPPESLLQAAFRTACTMRRDVLACVLLMEYGVEALVGEPDEYELYSVDYLTPEMKAYKYLRGDRSDPGKEIEELLGYLRIGNKKKVKEDKAKPSSATD